MMKVLSGQQQEVLWYEEVRQDVGCVPALQEMLH